MVRQTPPFLRFENVGKQYGGVRAVADVTLDIAAGEFVALVGASGSGKSTMLKTVNRLVEADRGRVRVEGGDVTALSLPVLRHRIGYVFQGIGLFNHMTVAKNIGIVPRLEGKPLDQSRLENLLALVELDLELAERFPEQLSGGQRQRVGVARALAGNPDLLLMDEPFGALDPVTRDALGDRVRNLHDELDLTTVMVTHDMTEALLLATRVLVMDSGAIVADATPAELLAGEGGEIAQALVAVPRAHAKQLADITP